MVLFARLFPSFVWKLMIIVILIRALPSIKNYEFGVKGFKDVASKAANRGTGPQAVESLVADLRREHGYQIPKTLQWIPFSAGGLKLKAQIVYPGIMEYIINFASSVRTAGRSGFHWSNSTCTVLAGELTRFNDATAKKETFTPGNNLRHGEFESYVYEFAPDTYVACYGRGVVPLSSAWPVAGAISDGDPIGILKMAYVYGDAYYRHTVESVRQLWNRHAPKQWRGEL